MWKLFSLLMLAVVVVGVMSSPMVYRKNDNDNYEPDLVPVSSTVIPIALHDDNPDHNMSAAEYKRAFLKHMHKKAHSEEDPDTLLTLVKKPR